MKILILGGSSFVGLDTAKHLADLGHEVSIFTRGNQPTQSLPLHHRIKGDRNHFAHLSEAAKREKWDVLIDNLAFNRQNVEDSLRAFPDVRHYILTSTVSVYRYCETPFPVPCQEEQVDHELKPEEEDPSDVHWAYARGKLEAEKTLMASSTPWTILRPSVIYGPRDPKWRTAWYLARMEENLPILLSNGGEGRFRLTYSQDIPVAISTALSSPHSTGKIYNLAQREILTLRELLDASAKALGLTPKYVDIPSSQCPAEALGPHGLLKDVIPDISKAEKDLQWSPTPASDFMNLTAHWYRIHGQGERETLLQGREKEEEVLKSLKSK